MPRTHASLDDLSNEVLIQIAEYADAGAWERLPLRLSVYGVLSRVNRRLHDFALPYLFFRIRIPVTTLNGKYALKPRPLVKLLRLLQDDQDYGRYIRHLQVGRATYSYGVDAATDQSTFKAASQHAWEFLDTDRPSWDLDSFTCFLIGCNTTTLHILRSCRHLTTLSMYWLGPDFPDLMPFPQLETLRLQGPPVNFLERRSKLVRPCTSLRTLNMRGDVGIPANFTEELATLFPVLQVLALAEAPLTSKHVLRMIISHEALEEVSIDLKSRCILGNILDVTSGRVCEWPLALNADEDHPRTPRDYQYLWRRVMTTGFAFVREKALPINGLRPYTPFNLTSLALKVAEDADNIVADPLLALLDKPPKMSSMQTVRHLALSIEPSRSFRMFPRDDSVSDFMEHLGKQLAKWKNLETFTFVFSFIQRYWSALGFDDPVLDDGQQPSVALYEEEDFPMTTRGILEFRVAENINDMDDVEHALEEAAGMLGRSVTLDDEDVNLDELWLSRRENEFASCVRKMAERCPKLREFNWYARDHWPGVSWAWRIRRKRDGGVQAVSGKASHEGSLCGEAFPFHVLVGQELHFARAAWR
ncbi:uncharacterized protein SCHCODRAFT_02536717 [Schizophyllum commune H4-8]|uniref:uncharacterized protein n=1 Tax=Schizophyllum commune (strain H4-8 / FGSC 9210) TaxID=578458 RepID=UPI00215E4210|nr:uncharacterized protein SCHCODRAFT_02536717 [Schizophyllum commune H4-8]KAI5895538.1 hypothetical protein SCHCODRAFT_02536717 [Schizophyllum commune H4-8]